MRAGSFAGSLFIRIRDAKKFLFFIFFSILYVTHKNARKGERKWEK